MHPLYDFNFLWAISTCDAPCSPQVRLSVDVARLASLGVKGAAAGGEPRLRASPIDGFQPEGAWAAGEALELQAKGSGHNEGWLLELVF